MQKKNPCDGCPNEDSPQCQYCVDGSRNPDNVELVPYINFSPTFSVRFVVKGSEDLPLLSIFGKKK